MKYAVIIFLSLTLSCVAYSDTKSSNRINLFKDAVEAIGAAGDAIESLTDSIGHLIKTGNDGYDYVAANREYNRLKDLSARSTNLVNLKQEAVVKSIDGYLAIDKPSNYDWDSLIQGIPDVVSNVKLLLDDVKEERSDFILEDAYAKMGSSLQSRTMVLNKISSLPKPNSKEELEQLRKLNEEYKRLIASFKDAIKQLNTYIKQSKDA
ncbi:MAG: hypothetical protein ACI89M_002231 [Chitinophagales bacterium]|jgi:hypothetical protein